MLLTLCACGVKEPILEFMNCYWQAYIVRPEGYITDADGNIEITFMNEVEITLSRQSEGKFVVIATSDESHIPTGTVFEK